MPTWLCRRKPLSGNGLRATEMTLLRRCRSALRMRASRVVRYFECLNIGAWRAQHDQTQAPRARSRNTTGNATSGLRPQREARTQKQAEKQREGNERRNGRRKRAKQSAQNEAQKKAHAAVSCLRSVSRTCGSCRRASSSECATPRPPATDCRHDGATPPR